MASKCPDLELVALSPWAGEGTVPSRARLKHRCPRSCLRPFLPPSLPSRVSHPIMTSVDLAMSWLSALIRKVPGQLRSSHSLTWFVVSPVTQVHSPTCYWKCSLRAQSCPEHPSHPSPSPHPTSEDVHGGGGGGRGLAPRKVAPARVSALSPPPQECPCVLTALWLQQLKATGADPGAHLSLLGEDGQPLGPGDELGSGQSLRTGCHNW